MSAFFLLFRTRQDNPDRRHRNGGADHIEFHNAGNTARVERFLRNAKSWAIC